MFYWCSGSVFLDDQLGGALWCFGCRQATNDGLPKNHLSCMLWWSLMNMFNKPRMSRILADNVQHVHTFSNQFYYWCSISGFEGLGSPTAYKAVEAVKIATCGSLTALTGLRSQHVTTNSNQWLTVGSHYKTPNYPIYGLLVAYLFIHHYTTLVPWLHVFFLRERFLCKCLASAGHWIGPLRTQRLRAKANLPLCCLNLDNNSTTRKPS